MFSLRKIRCAFPKAAERTTFIILTCKESDEYCFCTSVGLSPSDTRGSDITMTDTGNSFYVEVVTEKGKKLIDENSKFFAIRVSR